MESIPDGNLFMYCERPDPAAFTPVPAGFQQIPFTADKRENHLTDLLPVLSRVMTPESYGRLRFAQCPKEFLQAAAACPDNRF